MTKRTPTLISKYVNGAIHADRDTLARNLGYAARTIRAYCKPLYYDPASRRAIYDAHAVCDEMERRGVVPRRDKQGVPRPRRPLGAGRRPHRRVSPA